MLKIGGGAANRGGFDPVQRQSQWRQLIASEERTYGAATDSPAGAPPLVPGATAIGSNHAVAKEIAKLPRHRNSHGVLEVTASAREMLASKVLPPLHTSKAKGGRRDRKEAKEGSLRSGRSNRSSGSARSTGSRRSSGSARSGHSRRSGGGSVHSGRSGRSGGGSSYRSGRSYGSGSYGSRSTGSLMSARSGVSSVSGRSRSGSSVFSFGSQSSMPSSASGMTSAAMMRLEKLEATLNEERALRQNAEKQLESLRKVVDERLQTLGDES